MMELIRNIAAIVGLVLSIASLITLLSKKVRDKIGGVFVKYGRTKEVADSIEELRDMIEKNRKDDLSFREEMIKANEINVEFMKNQCRDTVKSIFYKYNDVKVLPLYERKTLALVRSLYVDRLHGNTFALLLLNEMDKWDTDVSEAHPMDQNEL